MELRKLNHLWLISGELTPTQRKDLVRSGSMNRTVLLESFSIPSLGEAEAALLHNWSIEPHNVVLTSITMTKQPHVIVQPVPVTKPEPEPGPEPSDPEPELSPWPEAKRWADLSAAEQLAESQAIKGYDTLNLNESRLCPSVGATIQGGRWIDLTQECECGQGGYPSPCPRHDPGRVGS